MLTSTVLNTTASPLISLIPDVNHMSVDTPISAEDHFPASGLDKDSARGSMPSGSEPYITDPTLLNLDVDHLSTNGLTYDKDHYHVSDPLYATGMATLMMLTLWQSHGSTDCQAEMWMTLAQVTCMLMTSMLTLMVSFFFSTSSHC